VPNFSVDNPKIRLTNSVAESNPNMEDFCMKLAIQDHSLCIVYWDLCTVYSSETTAQNSPLQILLGCSRNLKRFFK